jgi:hypothetical protein
MCGFLSSCANGAGNLFYFYFGDSLMKIWEHEIWIVVITHCVSSFGFFFTSVSFFFTFF